MRVLLLLVLKAAVVTLFSSTVYSFALSNRRTSSLLCERVQRCVVHCPRFNASIYRWNGRDSPLDGYITLLDTIAHIDCAGDRRHQRQWHARRLGQRPIGTHRRGLTSAAAQVVSFTTKQWPLCPSGLSLANHCTFIRHCLYYCSVKRESTRNITLYDVWPARR